MSAREIKVESLFMPMILLSGLSVLLLAIRSVSTGTSDFWFLNWNLFLAWLPIVFAWYFLRAIQVNRLKSWQVILPLVLWVLFLPNSFYLVTDFVHLEPYQDVSLVFDIVMLMSYALTGLILGMISVYLVHYRLKRRFPKRVIFMVIGFIFWLCGLAIYYGRNLGWNSWDLLANPSGILLDTIDRVADPFGYMDTFSFSLLFLVFLSTVYASFYYIAKLFRD